MGQGLSAAPEWDSQYAHVDSLGSQVNPRCRPQLEHSWCSSDEADQLRQRGFIKLLGRLDPARFTLIPENRLAAWPSSLLRDPGTSLLHSLDPVK